MMQPQRILIIDDHEVVREGLKRLFDSHLASIHFGEASAAEQAIEMVRNGQWDIALLDLRLGDQSGLEILAELKSIRPELRVLIFTTCPEEQYARRAFKAGASGYITKDSSRDQLLVAIETVLAGGAYLSPKLAEHIVNEVARGDDDRHPHEDLTNRELEVMRLIARGNSAKRIAETLRINHKTVGSYRVRIMEKMGLKTDAELTDYAIKHKIID